MPRKPTGFPKEYPKFASFCKDLYVSEPDKITKVTDALVYWRTTGIISPILINRFFKAVLLGPPKHFEFAFKRVYKALQHALSVPDLEHSKAVFRGKLIRAAALLDVANLEKMLESNLKGHDFVKMSVVHAAGMGRAANSSKILEKLKQQPLNSNMRALVSYYQNSLKKT